MGAELAQDHCTVRQGGTHTRTRIEVDVSHVAEIPPVSPPAGVVHQSRRVILLDPLGQTWSVELAPPLVEGNPHDDRRMVPRCVDHASELQLELSLPLIGVAASARHVLPYQDAQLVAPIVESLRFELDVFAHHVEAEAFCGFDVIPQCFVRGSRIQTVRPPALVQRAVLKERLVVEHDAVDAAFIFADRYFSHAEVAVDRVDCFARPVFQRHVQIVQERRVG
ncbi:hypothetical protein ES703_77541 [subsurface metagenome]